MDRNRPSPAALNLRSHLKENATKQIDFAKAVGISPGFLNDILKGRRRPSFEKAVKIQLETGGVVALDMWVRKPEGGADARA